MMLRNPLKSLLSLLLFFGLSITSFQVLAVTVTVGAIVPAQGCTTALTEWGFPTSSGTTATEGMYFYDFNASNNTTVAGSLCPGTYQIYANCTANMGGSCGGSSCGWGVAVNAIPVAGGNAAGLAGTSGHDGCTHNHGNPCENQTIHMWTNQGTYDTKTYQNIYIISNVESGNTQSCILSAQYKGPA